MDLIVIIPAAVLVSIGSGLLSAAALRGQICESIRVMAEEIKLLRGALEGPDGLRERITRIEAGTCK